MPETDLVRTEHLRLTEDGCYAITPKGLKNSEICESSLPYSVRLRTDKNVAEYNRLLLRKNQVQSRVAAQENGSYLVELRLQDDVDSILHLELTAATEAMARDLADRFRKDPEGIYTRLLSALYPRRAISKRNEESAALLAFLFRCFRRLCQQPGGNGTGGIHAAAAVFHQHHKGQGQILIRHKAREPRMGRLTRCSLGGAGLGAHRQRAEHALSIGLLHIVVHHIPQHPQVSASKGPSATARRPPAGECHAWWSPDTPAGAPPFLPPAREPKSLRNAQGFTRSSYWPTPDQPRSAP